MWVCGVCVSKYTLMDDAGWYRMHCHLQLHWIFFCKSKISSSPAIAGQSAFAISSRVSLYIAIPVQWNMRKSLAYTYIYITINFTAMKSRLLFKWNMITCHNETNYSKYKYTHTYTLHTHLFMYTQTVLFICPHPSFSAVLSQSDFSPMQMEMHTSSKNHNVSSIPTSAIRVVHVTPLTILKPI